jgi:hypothetical protein
MPGITGLRSDYSMGSLNRETAEAERLEAAVIGQ